MVCILCRDHKKYKRYEGFLLLDLRYLFVVISGMHSKLFPFMFENTGFKNFIKDF